jgi:propanol-preferring alcohol dehydrogenase
MTDQQSDPSSGSSSEADHDSIPERMQCLRMDEWGGDLQVAEATVPDPAPDEVLIDVEATGVGRTVANVMAGNMNDDPDDLPRISGHEIVGRIAATGAGVTHLSPGEYVTV